MKKTKVYVEIKIKKQTLNNSADMDNQSNKNPKYNHDDVISSESTDVIQSTHTKTPCNNTEVS